MLKRNKKLLLRAAKRIEDVPQSYDQATFHRIENEAPCGTAGCLAGEIIVCSERSVMKGIEKLGSVTRRWSNLDEENPPWPGDVAGDLAGFTSDERYSLFVTTNGGTWPPKFANRYYKAKTQRGRANAAAALLRYLANGGEV